MIRQTCEIRRAVRTAVLPLGLLPALLGVPVAAEAQTPDSAAADRATQEGHGRGYWGVVPPPSDSSTGRFENHPVPLWEQSLLVPYRLVALPFKLLAWGLQTGVVGAAQTPAVRTTVRYLIEPRRYKLIPSFQVGGLEGTGGGLGLRVEPFLWPGSRFQARGSATVPGDRRLHFGAIGPLGSTMEVQMGAGFRRRHNARFSGLGPGAPERDLSVYENEELWAGAGVSWSPGGDLVLEADAFWSRVGAFPSDADDHPPLERTFFDLPPGFGRFSRGVSTGLALVHATADGIARPSSGGIRRLKAAYLTSTDEVTPDHWTYRGELQQFVGLLRSSQVLAIRAYASWLEPSGDGDLPFQRLMTNDEPDLLRGYQDFRWRDRGMAVLSVEYRWPLWVWAHAEGAGLDFYLLSDVGQVFGERSDLAIHRLTTSWGAGIRVLGANDFLGLVELARSDEQWVFRIRGEQIFQFGRGGMYYGRSRVPNR